MGLLKKALTITAVIAVGEAFLLFISALLIVLFLWFTRYTGIQHMLGMDTQTSKNYASVSGYLPIMVAVNGFSGLLVTAYRHINCEHPGCWKPGHRHPGHGRPVCRDHYHSEEVVPEKANV